MLASFEHEFKKRVEIIQDFAGFVLRSHMLNMMSGRNIYIYISVIIASTLSFIVYDDDKG